ncbi:hypothetical protein EJ07DRAFT_155218 [Lizonia empirigonia]|nr:hypothetical protein EJ07DRAFT_155218 [Lizonia empirigonia]
MIRARKPSNESSLDGLPSVHDPYIDHGATSAIYHPTADTNESQDGPSISITPPEDSPTKHDFPASFYQLSTVSTGAALAEAPRVSTRSFERSTWRHVKDPAWRRSRSESPSSASKDWQGSLYTSVASKRNGMIGISDFDQALDSQSSSALPFVGMERLGITPTDSDYQSGLDGGIMPMVPFPVRHGQAMGNDPRLLLDELAATTGGNRNVSPLINAGHSQDDKRESPESGKNTTCEDISPIGKWRCCECQSGHEIYRFETGQHLISILNCPCKHRSCKSCTFQGNVRRFAPIDDTGGVASVPLPDDDGDTIQFGVICRTCGLSWRAERVKQPKRRVSLRRKLSVMPKANPLHKLRHTRSMIHLGFISESHSGESRPGTAMSTSRSIINLKLASDSQAKGARVEGQAPGAEVRFYGIECTCGSVTDTGSVCFQIVKTPEVDDNVGSKGQISVAATGPAEPQSVLELRAKGYGTPTLHLKGGPHPNPLRSNPM